MSFRELENKYLYFYFKIKELEEQKEEIRTQMIEFIGEQEWFETDNIEINKYQPQPTVDWKKVQIAFRLTEDKLNPFMVEKEAYYKVNVKRNAVVKKTMQEFITEMLGQ